MDKGGISIIICCYNSATRLKQTIRHLALQKVSADINWEIIVVNNASTDNTAETAKMEWQNFNTPGVNFRVIDELKPGVCNARETGIQNSNFDYILFCDDDNWLHEDYVGVAYNTISVNPKMAALGGQSVAVSDIPLPDWFNSSAANYAVGKQAESSGDVSSRKFLWTGGIVIRKSLYKSAFTGFPYLLIGRNGKELTSGEDSEICMRFLLMGYRLFYTEKLLFSHYIAPERLTPDYNKRLMQGFIDAHEVLKIYASFIDAAQLRLIEKSRQIIKPMLRLITAGLTGTSRWNVNAEKLKIYVISRINLRNIDEKYILIAQFIKRSRNNGYYNR